MEIEIYTRNLDQLDNSTTVQLVLMVGTTSSKLGLFVGSFMVRYKSPQILILIWTCQYHSVFVFA